jgi:hypothetical protein
MGKENIETTQYLNRKKQDIQSHVEQHTKEEQVVDKAYTYAVETIYCLSENPGLSRC